MDGGTYNGQTITGIGLTKAAHIYFRAMSVYQNPATDFADHADAIEQSAADLVGVNLADLATGAPSGQIITAADLAQVHKAMLAVEMRNPPTQCNFQPLLGQNPPAARPSGSTGHRPSSRTTSRATPPAGPLSHERDGTAASPTATGPSAASAGRSRGQAPSSAPNPDIGTCAPGGDESGVLHLTSPAIPISRRVSSGPLLTFEHWVATEAGWDGGNSRSASTVARGRSFRRPTSSTTPTIWR